MKTKLKIHKKLNRTKWSHSKEIQIGKNFKWCSPSLVTWEIPMEALSDFKSPKSERLSQRIQITINIDVDVGKEKFLFTIGGSVN